VLATLTVVYTLNFIDRGLVTLLLQPIKDDLHLSDTQLGFLTGIAFALFYSTLGLPIARWTDRGNRAAIASGALALWGVTVMSCVYVTSFSQLVLARVAAGVGEAGCMPPTYSLVGDYFPEPRERTHAMAIYWLANPLALLASFIAGGWLNEHYGWRVAFFVMGIPALTVAAVVRLTVVDPRVRSQAPNRQLPSMNTVLGILWVKQTARHLTIAIVLLFTLAFGMASWYAAFMIRSHNMSISEVGVSLGLIFGLGGIVSILLGGYVGGRWLANNEGGQLRLSAAMVASLVPFSALFLLVPNEADALAALIPVILVLNFYLGPSFALLQRLVADEMRATTVAVLMLLANLIGMGIGPQLVGMLSDFLEPHLHSNALRYAMLTVSTIALWSAYHFWTAGESVEQDLATA
jgi:predicted MFS family arabinose efflux permease